MIFKQPMNEEKALQKLAAMCAKAEHCTGEALDKMRKWGLDEAAQERVINKLHALKYIDDERYTRSFVHDKIEYNHWGRRKIEQALWLKHVDSSVYTPVLDEVSDDDYLAILRPLVKKKMQEVKANSDYERAMKTIKYAMSRGFTIDLIRKCVDQADEIDDAL